MILACFQQRGEIVIKTEGINGRKLAELLKTTLKLLKNRIKPPWSWWVISTSVLTEFIF